MPHRRDHDNIVDNSPVTTPETQYSGYTPAREFGQAGVRADGGQRVQEKAKETATRAQEKAQEVGQKAEQQADVAVDKTAEGLESTAQTVRERFATRDGVTGDVGMKAADTMERTAGYLREHDTAEIIDDVERYVREHPMQALAGAVVGGFLIGRLLG
jgi:ElaB/YqjD/DUF883 family membrane-anchored ribosome-binding protein